MRGFPATSGGKSHSWLTATRSSRRPSAATISVAAGRSETTRIAPGYNTRSRSCYAGEPMAAHEARVVVAPDATTRLAAARAFLAALPPDADALVIAPTWEACDDL